MERLKFKTRGMRSPQGIPRVFYCCHPKDFGRFFESVSDEILAKQNCAVFYDSTPETERDEQFFFDLKQMQLFVMPVTSELLYTPNTALAELFPFAIENHIPVLPIMQESGLEQTFNEKCGDLQFLDKTSTDITAISYDEKLEKYLSSVLIGDEMAEKIRDAFDAYVFLSYRKKDRKYAQELMKLIHKNDFCRDIAIWYDEFLTPGENFNNSIKTALKKSGLFVLAVTPNLVNEDNYVMTEEYPKARDAGKPILPAELVKTDKILLAEKFKSIPDCIDAYNDEIFSSALFEAVKNIAIKENDNSPEHNFFIGLAYLGGVDVEVDHEKALELITFAAEHNVVEAIDKLVEMYRTGHGVERDYLKAIEWQEKLIKIAKEKYNADPSEDNQSTLFWKIIYCGDYYKEMDKFSKAKEKYEQAQKIICHNSDEMSSYQKWKLAISFERLADVSDKEGHLIDSLNLYLEALNITKELYNHLNDLDLKKGMISCLAYLGDIYFRSGDYTKAKSSYEEASEFAFTIADDSTNDVSLKREMNIIEFKIADIYLKEGKFYEAKKLYLKRLETALVITEESNDMLYKRDVFMSYHHLGLICLEIGDLSEAKQWEEKSLIISIECVEETGLIKDKRSLALTYLQLSQISLLNCDIINARQFAEKCLAILNEINDKTQTLDSKIDLSKGYTHLGKISNSENDSTNEKKFYEKSLDILLEIGIDAEIIDVKSSVAECYCSIAGIYVNEGSLSEAMIFYEKSIEICTELLSVNDDYKNKKVLALAYLGKGDVKRINNIFREAQVYFEKGQEILINLSTETWSLEVQKNLSLSYERIGFICEANKDYITAIECCERAVAIRLSIQEKIQTVDSQIDLAVSYINIGYMNFNLKKANIARSFFVDAVNLLYPIANKANSFRAYEFLAECYINLSHCEPRHKNKYLKKSIDIYKNLIKIYPNVKKYKKSIKQVRDAM